PGDKGGSPARAGGSPVRTGGSPEDKGGPPAPVGGSARLLLAPLDPAAAFGGAVVLVVGVLSGGIVGLGLLGLLLLGLGSLVGLLLLDDGRSGRLLVLRGLLGAEAVESLGLGRAHPAAGGRHDALAARRASDR